MFFWWMGTQWSKGLDEWIKDWMQSFKPIIATFLSLLANSLSISTLKMFAGQDSLSSNASSVSRAMN